MKHWLAVGVGSLVALGLGGQLLTATNSASEQTAMTTARAGEAAAAPEGRQRPAAPAETLVARLAQLRRGLNGDLEGTILERLLALAETEPETAVRLAAMLTAAEGREQALHECLPHWLNSDPPAARDWLLGDAQGLPFDLIGVLARDTAAIDPRLGLQVTDKLPIGERASPIGEVFSAWAAKDPAEASRIAEELGAPRDRAAAVQAVGKLWAEGDAEAAFDWAARGDMAGSRRVALESVVGAWARRKPEAAARSVATLPAGEVFRQRLLDHVAMGWLESDPEEALDWADALPEPQERESTATTILLHLASSAPERAAAEAYRISDGKMSPLVDKVLVAWAARDKSAADGWVRSHRLSALTP